MALPMLYQGITCLFTGSQCSQGTNSNSRGALDPAGERAARLALRKVEESFHFFLQKGLASSTKRCYESGQRRFLSFCDRVNLPHLPASEETIYFLPGHGESIIQDYKVLSSCCLISTHFIWLILHLSSLPYSN